jgi:hypothetical protein
MAMTRKNWIAVASAEHAHRGRDDPKGGFMQVGHGKLAPLKFRFGLFEVDEHDIRLIAGAMNADLRTLEF